MSGDVVELVKHLPDELYRRALSEWTWLRFDGLTPLCASPFGDVFFGAADGVWWLDQLEGTLTREFGGQAEMEEVLASEDGQDRYLLLSLAQGAMRLGVRPGPEEVFGFSVSPLLGAPFAVENVQAFPFVACSAINAALHAQLRD